MDEPLISRNIFRGGGGGSGEEEFAEPRTGKLSKKLAKAERDWHSGMSGTSHVRVWDVRAARAVHENKKKAPSR